MPLAPASGERLRLAGIHLCARVTTPTGWQIRRPHHTWHFSCLVVHGTYQLTLPTGGQRLRPGSPAWLVPQPQPYELEAVGEGLHQHLWWSIEPSRVQVADTARPWPAAGLRLARSLADLIDEGHDPAGEAARTALADLAEIDFDRCLRAIGGQRHEVGDPVVQRLLAAITADPAFSWRLEELARLADCSAGHLVRRFHAAGLRAPMAEVQRVRLDQARRLLPLYHNLAEVAALVGYATPFALSRAFSRAFGHSPSAVRARRLAGDR